MGKTGIVLLTILVSFIIGEFFGEKHINGFMDKSMTRIIKGFAILFVVCAHVAGEFGTRLLTPLGGIGVSLFLIVSGYGLNESVKNNGTKAFWRKRLLSLYPAYIMITVVAIIIGKEYDIKTIFMAISFVKPVIPYGWYFRYLLVWYFVFWISCIIQNRQYQIHICLLFAVISILVFPEIMAEQSLSFVSGILLSYRKDSVCKLVTDKKRMLFLAISLVILGGVFLGIKQLKIARNAPQIIYNMIQLLIKLPIGLGTLLLVYCFSKKLKYTILFYLGLISYEVYLVHGLCLEYLFDGTLITLLYFVVSSAVGSVILYTLNNKVTISLRRLVM